MQKKSLLITLFMILSLIVSAQESSTWEWHSDGAFKYPGSFSHTKLFVDDVPGIVEVFSNESNVLVLIYPPSEQNNVSELINVVKDW